MTITTYNADTRCGIVQFIGQPTRRERDEVSRDCARFLLAQSAGESVKTRVIVPGEPEKIMFVSRASSLPSVLAV